MEKKEEELDSIVNKNYLDWLIFKIHGLSSNHSQDWLLTLFWIFTFSFAFAFSKWTNENLLDNLLEYFLIDLVIYGIVLASSFQVIKSKFNYYWLILLMYIVYCYLTKDIALYYISNNINPFSIMSADDDLTIGILLYKIIIGYLIYQFIISIRQNTRRK